MTNRRFLLVFILMMTMQLPVFATEVLVLDLDLDQVSDSVYFDQKTSKIACKLSSEKFTLQLSKTLGFIGENTGVKKAKNGFYCYSNWMRSGVQCQFRYSPKIKKIELIGLSRFELGTASNDGSGESSVNLLTNVYVGNWNYYSDEDQVLIKMPSIKGKMILGKIALQEFGDLSYSDYMEKCSNLFLKYKGLDVLRRNLRKQLSLLESYSEDTDEFNFDSLVGKCNSNLEAYLRIEAIHARDSLPNLKILPAQGGEMTVYSYAFNSGGTRGDVNKPIVQWKKSDHSFGVYSLNLEMGFYEMHKLPAKEGHELFVLIGSEKANSKLIRTMALVLEVRNNYLIADYPAFLGKSAAFFIHDVADEFGYGADITYNSKTKLLTASGMEQGDQLGIEGKNTTTLETIHRSDAATLVFSFDGIGFNRK